MSSHWIETEAVDGYQVPLKYFQPERPSHDPSLIMLPALGISASFYDRIAQALCAQGFNLVVLEQRGHGQSRLRASRRTNFGFKEALEYDIPATLDWCWQNLPGSRRVIIGHSLGGHLAAMAAGLYPNQIDGIILSACGTPWKDAYSGKMRLQLPVLEAFIRLTGPLLGYFPGKQIGFGGREARQLMRDWSQMLESNRYLAQGIETDLDAAVSNYARPVLALRYEEDDFAPAAAVHAVTRKFAKAQLSQQIISSAELGGAADHYRWVRQAEVASDAITQWLCQFSQQKSRAA